MAKKRPNEVAVGITVLVVLVLTIYIVLALADWSNLFRAQQEITVQLPYQVGLKGLTEGSPIYLGGAKIGQIVETQIKKLAPTPKQKEGIFVFFTMRFPSQYQLRKDCVLAPQSNVLGGQAALAIKELGSQGEIIQDGQTVQLTMQESIADAIDTMKRELNPEVAGSLLFRLKKIAAKIDKQVTVDEQRESLIAKIHQILDRLGNISERVDNQLDTADKAAMLAKLHTALDKLDHSLAQIDALIETNKQPVTEMVASLRNTARDIEEKTPGILNQIKEALAKADSAIETAGATLTDLKELIGNFKETYLVNRDSINRIVSNMTELSANLKMASREIRRAPWKLIYKPKKGELHIQKLIDSAGDFAAGAERLDNAALRLQAMLQATGERVPVNKERIRAIFAELETSFSRYKQAEDKFWKELK